jgi:Magnesium chelatase, subunit ChlI
MELYHDGLRLGALTRSFYETPWASAWLVADDPATVARYATICAFHAWCEQLPDDLPAFGPKLAPLSAILDNRVVRVERPDGSLTLPASFQLMATGRPCACGWFGDPEAICTCTPAEGRRYQQRIPAALRDRIELHLEVPRVAYKRLTSGGLGEPSVVVRERVGVARQCQAKRFAPNPGRMTNAELRPEEIRAGSLLLYWSPAKTLRRGICRACRAKRGLDVDDVDETVAEVEPLSGVALQQAIEDTVILRFSNTPITLVRKLRSVSDLAQLASLRRKVLEAPDQAAVEALLAALAPVA